MSDEEDPCGDICGDTIQSKCSLTLKCNHTYHYECIQKTFLMDRKKRNKCPLCSQIHGLLPLVNGIPKLYYGIHYLDEYPKDYQCKPCTQLLKSGKRKGCECGAKPMLGSEVCKRHSSNK